MSDFLLAFLNTSLEFVLANYTHKRQSVTCMHKNMYCNDYVETTNNLEWFLVVLFCMSDNSGGIHVIVLVKAGGLKLIYVRVNSLTHTDFL